MKNHLYVDLHLQLYFCTPCPHDYHKIPQIGSPYIFAAIILEFQHFGWQCLKDEGRMANSVDPDQTAPPGAVWSGSALFAQTNDHYGMVNLFPGSCVKKQYYCVKMKLV